MKKITTLVFAVMALSIVLVGCKGEETAAPEGTTTTTPTGTGTSTTPQ